MKQTDPKSSQALRLARVFLFVGLLASAVVYWEGVRLVNQELQSQLDIRAREAKHNLERQLDAYAEALRSLQAEYRTTSHPARMTFRQSVKWLKLNERLPAVQAVGFSERVPPTDKGAFERGLRKEYAAEFAQPPAIHPMLLSPAAEAFVVKAIEPLAKNRFGLGFDHATEPRRVEAIDRARDTGEWAATRRVRLFVEPGNVDGVVFYTPLYHGNIPDTMTGRREAFSGFFFLAIRVDEMLRNVFGSKLLDDLDIEIRDKADMTAASSGNDGQTLIFSSNQPASSAIGSKDEAEAPLRRTFDLTFGGNTWELSLTMRPNFQTRSQYWLPPIAALSGVLLSFLAFLFMRSLNVARQASDASMREAYLTLQSKEEQLNDIVESIDEVLWTFETSSGEVRYVSSAVERLYGRPARSFIENPRLWLRCIHPADRKQVIRVVRTLADKRRDAILFRIVRSDGAERWMHYEAHYVASTLSKPGRVDCLGRDITEQRQMEESLRRSNRALRTIHACGNELANAAHEHALLQGICEVVVREGYRMAWSGLLARDGSVEPAGIAGEHDGYLTCIEGSLQAGIQEGGSVGTTLRTGRPTVTNSFQSDPRMGPWREQALRRGFNSKITLPLVHDGQNFGVLNVYAAEPDAFDAEEVDLLTGLANSVAVAIQLLRHRSAKLAAEAAFHLRQRAIEASANAIVITSATAPNYPVEYVNPAFERMTGYSAQEIAGKSLSVLHQNDKEQPGLEELRRLLRAQQEGHVTLRNYRRDGSMFWTDVHVAPVRDESGAVTHFVGAKYDVTTTKRYEKQLEVQANRDALTMLANRNLLQDRLNQAISYASHDGAPVWVVFVDLDRFKFVNDTLGHQAGDVLLKQVSTRLLSVVRHTDTVARLGGDEFVLVLTEHVDKSLEPAIVQRIMDVIAPPFIIDGHEFFLTCSMGIAVYPTDGTDAETLIKHADIAMYSAKETGRDNFQFYTSSLNEKALARLHLEGDLRNALERGEFLLHYQPQLDLYTGNVVGMEALIRWQHPELGMVSPARFIGLAEEIGLIGPIGEWVIRTACLQNRAWQLAGLPPLRVAVNLSARQFADRGLAQSIASILNETGMPAQLLDIELTESMVMTDVDFAIGALRELKKLGVHLSVDDFGTGYSSLSYLKRFPIDVLKIDQSFVRDITLNGDGAELVRSIISLAHGLRLQVIAEGVETEEQLTYLWQHGCDQMQGYYFSKPLVADAFEQLLREGRKLSVQAAEIALSS
ncbi:bifunctional diguanylate cyclase/phosphodiesterase [Noviherbaspirillum autotrophicum]|uniref:bifunctional diguanylate cyclase/phosphodiesterase n=1 Tax=Noviherbaspirillum autotrophicum TaxID=709839 RepID=UPI000694699E|nr:EAL domain-containing protein [Noviherbaspirillum autotrophicum]